MLVINFGVSVSAQTARVQIALTTDPVDPQNLQPPATPEPPAAPQPTTAAQEDKATRGFVSALAHNLVDDVKHMPRMNSVYWLAGGGALALAVHPADITFNRHLTGPGDQVFKAREIIARPAQFSPRVRPATSWAGGKAIREHRILAWMRSKGRASPRSSVIGRSVAWHGRHFYGSPMLVPGGAGIMVASRLMSW